MQAVTGKKKQKTGATTSLLSPPRRPNTTTPSTVPFVTPPPAVGTKRCHFDIENDDEVQFLGTRMTRPSVDYPHSRFQCGLYRFIAASADTSSSSSITDTNLKHCDRCYCFICDIPAEECSHWNSHCNAHAEDPEWRKLHEENTIPKEITPAPVSRHAKKTTKQLKDILRKNGQHTTGRKAALLLWIADGERYGRLASCPECEQGRLKVLEHSPGMVICPGYYERGEIIPCDYCCSVEDAPRLGPWIDGERDETETQSSKDREKVEAMFKKMKVPEMKSMLLRNRQHITGNKSALLARIVDGYTHGRLDTCPECDFGRLKVNENCPDVIFCPGHYDFNAGAAVPCSFRCSADEAPRSAAWTD